MRSYTKFAREIPKKLAIAIYPTQRQLLLVIIENVFNQMSRSNPHSAATNKTRMPLKGTCNIDSIVIEATTMPPSYITTVGKVRLPNLLFAALLLINNIVI